MQWFTSRQGKSNSQASPSERGASREGLKKDGQANGGPSQGHGLAPTPYIKGPTVCEHSSAEQSLLKINSVLDIIATYRDSHIGPVEAIERIKEGVNRDSAETDIVFHCSRCGELVPKNHKYGDPCKKCGGLIVKKVHITSFDATVSKQYSPADIAWQKYFDDYNKAHPGYYPNAYEKESFVAGYNAGAITV